MYGSYPEMTIAMRFLAAKIQRIGNFFTKPPKKNWPLSYDDLLEIADQILTEKRERLPSRSDDLKLVNISRL